MKASLQRLEAFPAPFGRLAYADVRLTGAPVAAVECLRYTLKGEA